MSVVTYRAETGLWSACLPGTAILAHAVSRDACAAAIAAAVEGVDVDAVVASPVGPDEWRSALVASTVGALSDLRSDVDQLSEGALAQALVTKIEHVEGIVRECHVELVEANRLKAEANQQHERALRVAEQQERRIAEQKAAQAKADDEARWLDVKVSEGPGGVEVVKLHKVFEHWHRREPVFREWSTLIAKYTSREAAPPEVVARIGKPVKHSAEYGATPEHPYDRLVR
jgi:hypothetical protein